MHLWLYQNGTLIRKRGAVTTTFGPWQGRFGCWRSGRQEDEFTPYIPSTAFFDASGWHNCNPQPPLPFGDTLARGADALARYLQDIPIDIRRLAGEFSGRRQWLTLDMMRRVPGFRDFLEQERRSVGMGFAAACLTLADTPAQTETDRVHLARRMMAEPRHQLLRDLSGSELPPVVPRLLRKVDETSIDDEFLHHLRRAALTEGLAAVLAQLDEIDGDTLEVALTLPAWLQRPKVIENLWASGVINDPDTAISLAAVGETPAAMRPGIVRALQDMALPFYEDAQQALGRVALKVLGGRPFPPPPFAGTERLRPIRTFEDLQREGRIMGHCVGNYYQQVFNGFSYFYQWHGEERATAQLIVDHCTGNWELHEHLGPANRQLLPETVRTIAATVEACFGNRPFELVTELAGTQYHEGRFVLHRLSPWQPLQLVREPENPHDHRAVQVFSSDGVKLGYIPRRRNRQLASLLDAGQQMDVRVLQIPRRPGGDVRIRVRQAATAAA